jgi:hypothetical protein
MTFDIHRIDHLDSMDEDAYAAFEEYCSELLDLFAQSPEGQKHREMYPEGAWWAEMMMDYAFRYFGFSIAQIKAEYFEELISDVLPRKISLQKREEAMDAIPEMIAFWNFIKREFRTRNSGPILKYLETISPDDFADSMFDPHRAGMAKSFFMQGNTAGFDMTDMEQVHQFMAVHNAAQIMKVEAEKSKAKNDEAKEKKKRKAEKAARKRHKKK